MTKVQQMSDYEVYPFLHLAVRMRSNWLVMVEVSFCKILVFFFFPQDMITQMIEMIII